MFTLFSSFNTLKTFVIQFQCMSVFHQFAGYYMYMYMSHITIIFVTEGKSHNAEYIIIVFI